MQKAFIEINRQKIPVEIHLEQRSSSRVSIGKRAVYIRLPVSMDKVSRESQVKAFKEWAERRLNKNPGWFNRRLPSQYKNGDMLKVAGKSYRLEIRRKDKKSSSARIAGNTVRLNLSSNHSREEEAEIISRLISRCIASERLPQLKERIERLNRKYFGQKINRISFKYNRSNWGSCSRKKNINISTRLLLAPGEVLEYVCVHELAHLIEGNHSKKFWMLVERALPGYRKMRKWLKENHHLCWF